MNTPAKTCPACGADVSAGTAAMPGVCPACGRDLRLEEIAAALARSPNAKPARKSPINFVECAAASIGLALFLGVAGGLALGVGPEASLIAAMTVVGPNFFAGFVIAGRWKRTKPAQLCLGFLLGAGFIGASLTMLYAGCRTLGIH